MSLLDRIRTCRRWDPEAYRPFVIAGRRMGRVTRDFARRLTDFPAVFQVGEAAVALDDGLADFDSRTAAVHEVLLALRAAGELPIWRDEAYPVLRAWDEAPVMKMERGAVPLFGVRGFGVHLNGLVAKPDGLHLWVARRSLSKPTAPGKLDHIVAGGQPHGLGIRDNLIKECAEEAGLPAALAERAEAVGMISYVCERPEGLRDDVLFIYDLMLPESFQPSNADGEVEAFFLWPIERVRAVIAEGEEFKFNCALAIIDLLVRRGLITPDDADYQAIVHGLRSSE
jgi:hypothetical protein